MVAASVSFVLNGRGGFLIPPISSHEMPRRFDPGPVEGLFETMAGNVMPIPAFVAAQHDNGVKIAFISSTLTNRTDSGDAAMASGCHLHGCGVGPDA